MAKSVLGALKSLFRGINMVILYIRCSIRIISNFQKCVVFYLLDIVKYTILFFPLLCVSIFTGFNLKTMKSMFEKIDYMIQWDKKIRYDCYVCKKPKNGASSFWEKLKHEFEAGEKNAAQHLFFYFFCFLIVIMFICFQVFNLFGQNPTGAKMSIDPIQPFSGIEDVIQ